jgi:hypothetical protein
MKQLDAAASELPQAFDAGAMPNSLAFAPVMLGTMPVSGAVPVLVSVTPELGPRRKRMVRQQRDAGQWGVSAARECARRV